MKQIIILRKDLNMRKGKMAAQAAHASLGVLLKTSSGVKITLSDNFIEWLQTGQTKICVGCNSEEELLQLCQEAKIAKLPHCLVTDAGRTEFNGQPTITALAIGPAEDSLVDKITGKLVLL